MAIETPNHPTPPRHIYTLISAFAAFLLPLPLIYYGWFKWLDLFYRVCLAECNRRWNRRRELEQLEREPPKTMACMVGYREQLDVYEKSLASLAKANTACVIAAIDGAEEQDLQMVNKFREVFPDAKTAVLNLEDSPGKHFARRVEWCRKRDSENGQRDDSEEHVRKATLHGDGAIPADDPAASRNDEEAFHRAYTYVKRQLTAAGLLQSRNPPQAICFTQPHCDLKEIRFSAWMVSFVIADFYGLEYLWSSDSDTRVMPDTIDSLARVIRAEPTAAGGGVYVKLHNANASTFAQMAGIAWRLDTYMNRAALGAFGTSECLNGPSSMYRISALREVAVPQYRFHYFPQDRETYQNTVLNEDIQTTMLLAERGWKRLYVENAFVLTGGPETLRQWLGQRLRWSRGINLHRIFDAWYISSQGPLTAWYWIRSGFHDVLIFAWIAWYTFTGKRLFPVTLSDVVVMELLPPLYNAVRCPDSLPDYLTTIGLFGIYRLVCPSYRLYSLLTPFGISWSLPHKQKGERFDIIGFVRREHEALFFVSWISIAAGAAVRWVLSSGVLPHKPEFVVASFMISAWTVTSFAMFVV